MSDLKLSAIEENLVGPDAFFAFKTDMGRLGCEDDEVLGAIIQSIPVPMVDFLSPHEGAAYQAFCNEAMFANISRDGMRIIRAIDESVTIPDGCPRLEGWVLLAEFPKHRIWPPVRRTHRILVSTKGTVLAFLGAIFSLAHAGFVSASPKFPLTFKANFSDCSARIAHFFTSIIDNTYSHCGQGVFR